LKSTDIRSVEKGLLMCKILSINVRKSKSTLAEKEVIARCYLVEIIDLISFHDLTLIA